ncbi:glutathione synthetase large chain [Lepidopterella palustris CBS 459.81]|uniref:Glutathione synthetase n=1 Tax=Lepidopterella palustris CBS 459.81 TaxID=1314670 RepID=A0A8E2EIU9_9PEZI|nr:glutathione synthetase large chain [Lepidopterella palustris CBS 459.81]
MAPSLFPDYPPKLTSEQEQYLLSNLKDWSIAHGLAVRPTASFVSQKQDPSGVLATTAPVTLFPSLFPRACFEEGLAIQQAFNELYSAISRDENWLRGIVEELVDIDDFVAKLWGIHVTVKKEGYVQDLSLGLFRSDYMVHIDPSVSGVSPALKQVEFNTIASSFGGLSSQVSVLHNYLSKINAYPHSVASIIKSNSLPQSKSASSLAAGLAAAHKAYGSPRTSYPTCILFVVQDPERNVFDQRHLEYSLLEVGVRSFRLPFHRTLSDTKLESDRTLVYIPPNSPSTPYEITTAYFRAGYSPDDYPNPEDWTARLQLERSRAIKCPSILTHLAGCKKVQQVLATPHSPHLKRFLPNDAAASRVLATFAPIYPLDKSDSGMEARKLATTPELAQRYVLKPQREGGGNNVYRKTIPEFLKTLPESHWPAHILMEMIEPPALKNAILRNGEVQKGGVIGELGVYGVCLWKNGSGLDNEGKVLENWEAGYLLRTKGDQSEEGGVAAGFGAVDSCCLVDV